MGYEETQAGAQSSLYGSYKLVNLYRYQATVATNASLVIRSLRLRDVDRS